MEIPYIVTPRKDTGLFNSKIAIWLFLASEVMLFGGFFSAYIFLRLGADFPWPERTLPVLPGLINTFVLIASSVTVVFAWASLKMRQWGRFQIYMAFTVLCSLVFMGLKGIEYYVKLHHQAVRLKDYAVVEGHLGYQLKDGVHVAHGEDPKPEDYELDHNEHKIEENVINYETSGISFNTVRYYKPWVEEIMARAAKRGATVKLASRVELETAPGKPVVFDAGTPLDLKLLESIKQAHLAARAHNSELRTENLREQWSKAKEANPGKSDRELAPDISVDTSGMTLMPEMAAIPFTVEPATVFRFKPRDIKEDAGTLRDGTALTGKMVESPMLFHYVDAIDFRHTAMKAEEKGIDPMIAIENSWLLQENPVLREAWEWHKGEIAKLEKQLLDGYGVDKKTGKPKRVPTDTERYRIGWQDFVAKANGVDRGKHEVSIKEQFMGPDYHGREANHTFPAHISIPREQVQFASKFAPAWNTYYAIYFTMTGLHGLHVIGGAIVLAYYLFFGKKMYLSNPEWLANRVEVGGLFWHFVDLVWIFLFPILYLM